MVLTFFCVLLLAAGCLLWHLAHRPLVRRNGWPAAWRVACLIGTLRIGALWLGVAAFRSSGWPQVFGYFLEMLALPEIYLTRSVRADPLKWAILVSAMLAATSLFWGASLIWVANRLRRPVGLSAGERPA